MKSSLDKDIINPYSDENILSIIKKIRKTGKSAENIQGISSSYFYSRARRLGFKRKRKRINKHPKAGLSKYGAQVFFDVVKEINKGAPVYRTCRKYGVAPASFYLKIRQFTNTKKVT